MTHQTEISERQRRLHRLLKGETFTYYRSTENRSRYGVVFQTARKLSDMGHIQINQKRDHERGCINYMATGLLTENRKHNARDGEHYERG